MCHEIYAQIKGRHLDKLNSIEEDIFNGKENIQEIKDVINECESEDDVLRMTLIL